VVQATGVQPDTLRAWERRYGLPVPSRSEGGHRLYSRRDVEIVKWLQARQDEGQRISQAVGLWQSLEREGRDPLRMPRFASGETSLAEVDVAPAMAISRLKDTWVAACLAFDEVRADNILAQAFAIYPPDAVCAHLLAPALAEIGEGWYQNTISVQQEHFASELAVRRIESLLIGTPPPTRTGRILIADPPHEQHRFPPLMLNYMLRRSGWETLYLGENVPLNHLEAVVTSTRPTLVILVAQTLPTAADLLDMTLFLKDRGQRVAYGGLIFSRVPSLRQRIPGFYLGDRLEHAPHRVEEALGSPSPTTDYRPASEAMLTAARLFKTNRSAIDAEIQKGLDASGIDPSHLDQAQEGLGDSLYACLKLGDPEPLQTDLDWLVGLLNHHGVDRRQLKYFMDIYAETVKSHLPQQAETAWRWLTDLSKAEAES
jgi:DNA-binding transcriptional MerR regulator